MDQIFFNYMSHKGWRQHQESLILRCMTYLENILNLYRSYAWYDYLLWTVVLSRYWFPCICISTSVFFLHQRYILYYKATCHFSAQFKSVRLIRSSSKFITVIMNKMGETLKYLGSQFLTPTITEWRRDNGFLVIIVIKCANSVMLHL